MNPTSTSAAAAATKDPTTGDEAEPRRLARAGDHAAAASAFARLCEQYPDRAACWFGLARALAALHRSDEAQAALERYFALAPDQAVITEAAERQQRGDVQGAAELYRGVLARAPDNVDALRLLGVALGQLQRLDEAEACLRRAIAVAPDYVFAWNNLGSILGEMDRTDEAVAAFERALALDPEQAQSYFNLGNALATRGDQQGAETAYDRALARQPGHVGCLIGKGHVLKTIGRQQDAITAYRACLAQRPDYGEVWWSLANLKTFRFSDADMGQMESLLDEASLAEESRVSLLFALGKALEDACDHDAAFQRYAEGNALQRTRVAYDPLQTEIVTERLSKVFSHDLLRSRAGQGHADPAPILIVGLPRSGSTLLEQILASHSQVDGTSELPDLGRVAMATARFRSDGVAYPEAVRDLRPADLRALGRSYIEQTRRHRGAALRFTDKMPNNFASIGLLHLILPQARVIDARRHPMDSCMGAYKQLFARGQTFTYDLFELGEYYLQYDRLMAHWDAVLPGRVLRVNYEEMLADQTGQTRRLLDFCELPFEESCLRFFETERAVKTASSEQVRQPLYQTSLQSWRRFRPHLADLEARLAPVIARLPPHIAEPPVT